MYQGVTPTYTLTFDDPDLDLTTANNVCVTLCNNAKKVLLEPELEIAEKTISFSLTQEQTLALPEGRVLVQANWTFDNGKRACSNIVEVNFQRNLKNEVMA